MFVQGKEFYGGGGEGEKNPFISTKRCKTLSCVLL